MEIRFKVSRRKHTKAALPNFLLCEVGSYVNIGVFCEICLFYYRVREMDGNPQPRPYTAFFFTSHVGGIFPLLFIITFIPFFFANPMLPHNFDRHIQPPAKIYFLPHASWLQNLIFELHLLALGLIISCFETAVWGTSLPSKRHAVLIMDSLLVGDKIIIVFKFSFIF